MLVIATNANNSNFGSAILWATNANIQILSKCCHATNANNSTNFILNVGRMQITQISLVMLSYATNAYGQILGINAGYNAQTLIIQILILILWYRCK
jgi:hypothetical protein